MKKFLLLLNLLILPFTSALPAEVQEEEHQVVILGSGVGALTSAVYLSRAGITPVVITGPSVGGTITQSHNVQNWPGEMSISGVELGDRVRNQAELNGAILQPELVVSVDLTKRPFLITTKKIIGSTEQLKRYKAQSVIIALGATPNLLNVPGESGQGGYWSRGVYSCAVCDGSLYKDKVVTVVGGGDSALIEAQYLSNIASKVHLLVRRDEFRSVEKERMKEILSRPNIEVHYRTVVKEIRGDGDKVTHLLLESTSSKQAWELKTDALFLAIGALPNSGLFRNQLELDPSGYIVLKKHQQTSVDGVYAIGDVSDPEFKQAISAAGDAAKAAMQAQQYLASNAALSHQKEALAKAEIKPEARKVIEINSKEQFDKEIREADCAVFVDFYSTHCGPCRTFSPVYDEWAKQFGGKIKFLKVNADRAEEIFRAYQIRAVPTLVILDSKGNIIRKSTGFGEISEVDKRLEKMKDKTVFSPQDFR
ncbi:MAG: FAD-dependent oxidoreductase [Verrucomicrobia bacterium]|nr:FAD-dependent oxidoreductase [Verrucomicrobiota bacterium]